MGRMLLRNVILRVRIAHYRAMVIALIGGDGAHQNTAFHQIDHLTDLLSPQVKES